MKMIYIIGAKIISTFYERGLKSLKVLKNHPFLIGIKRLAAPAEHHTVCESISAAEKTRNHFRDTQEQSLIA